MPFFLLLITELMFLYSDVWKFKLKCSEENIICNITKFEKLLPPEIIPITVAFCFCS